MKSNLQLLLAILCVTHAVLVTVAAFEAWSRVIFLMIATAAWFLWPVIMWLARAKKWRLALPLLLGFAALLPAAAMCLLWFVIGWPYMVQYITAKRSTGQGDIGQFILQTAEQFGGTPTVTNGLPHIPGRWHCLKEKDRIIIELSKQTFPAVVDFLHRSFGQPDGYGGSGTYYEYDLTKKGAVVSARVYHGAVLYALESDEDTEVIIQSHPEPTLSMIQPNDMIQLHLDLGNARGVMAFGRVP